MAVVEFRHDTRVQVAPGSDKNRSVSVKIVGCEVASPEQEGALRETQRALYLLRTARGTIDEETGGVQLAEETLRRTGGLITAIEAAKLRAGLAHWTAYARAAVDSSPRLTVTEMAHELQAVADGLNSVLHTAADESDDDE
jgi:hypothetical protein